MFYRECIVYHSHSYTRIFFLASPRQVSRLSHYIRTLTYTQSDRVSKRLCGNEVSVSRGALLSLYTEVDQTNLIFHFGFMQISNLEPKFCYAKRPSPRVCGLTVGIALVHGFCFVLSIGLLRYCVRENSLLCSDAPLGENFLERARRDEEKRGYFIERRSHGNFARCCGRKIEQLFMCIKRISYIEAGNRTALKNLWGIFYDIDRGKCS